MGGKHVVLLAIFLSLQWLSLSHKASQPGSVAVLLENGCVQGSGPPLFCFMCAEPAINASTGKFQGLAVVNPALPAESRVFFSLFFSEDNEVFILKSSEGAAVEVILAAEASSFL